MVGDCFRDFRREVLVTFGVIGIGFLANVGLSGGFLFLILLIFFYAAVVIINVVFNRRA